MDIDQPEASTSTPPRSNLIHISEKPYNGDPQPAYDYRSVASHDPVICIDNGSSSWRAGFSGTTTPYIDRPNIVAKYRERKQNRNVLLFGRDVEADTSSRSSTRTMYDGDMLIHGDVLEYALDFTFLTLGINTGKIEHPIVMTERLANPLFTRALTSEMLFELYGAPSVTYGVDSLFAFSRQKHADGLAINMGHNATTVIPVVNGKGILSRSKRIPFGGVNMSETLLKLAQLKYPNFPLKVTIPQATFMARETCYFASDYEEELRALGDPAAMSAMTRIVQFPYSVPDVVEKTEAELAATSEKRKENGRRLQEMQQKQRADKFLETISNLEYYHNILAQKSHLSPAKFIDLILSETDFESEAELGSWVRKTDADVKRKQRKDAGEEPEPEEDPTFPLVDRPDEELTEEELKEKRKQRLMKAGWEARVKIREEKARQRERRMSEERREEEERLADPEAWAKRLRVEQESVMMRMEGRSKQKSQRKDRKSAAAQNRMKTIANLAAEDKVIPNKKRKKGDDDDGFGKSDADWAVYREVGGDDSEAEDDDLAALQSIESRLLQFDNSFTQDDTMTGRAQVKNALINAFVRGGGSERFDPGDLQHSYQLHLNVERIRVPETWFQPAMFGIDSAGLGEVAGWLLNGFEEEQRRKMMQCIFVTGGASSIPNFFPRLRNALTPVLPFRAPLKIVSSLDGGDPKLEAWKGMAEWSVTEAAKSARVTREEYLEYGGEWVKEHAWGNPAI